ncbi:hypothetical protein Sjap_013369 [Stephania japonica]|uniref:Uncharacterized protein n=1 Tax=Stephania japonica TaxID=461633 RepID=A0AAP0IZQ8_9MAGN
MENASSTRKCLLLQKNKHFSTFPSTSSVLERFAGRMRYHHDHCFDLSRMSFQQHLRPIS